MSKIIHPACFLVVKREENAWYFKHGKVFYSGRNTPFDLENREEKYELTKEKIVIELFRLGAGRAGYYLANLKDKKYYYCGLTLEDVRATLLSLGIGRADPIEK